MKKIFKRIFVLLIICIGCISLAACGNDSRGSGDGVSEKLELSNSMLKEVEFSNGKSVKLEQKENEVTILGNIDAMSKSQKNAYGIDEVSHVVVVKVTFDRERTISSFTIKGNITKVYSDDDSVENYTGKLTDLLDNEQGEDAYCELILSANTKEYKLISSYSDNTESTIVLKINATLATATAE